MGPPGCQWASRHSLLCRGRRGELNRGEQVRQGSVGCKGQGCVWGTVQPKQGSAQQGGLGRHEAGVAGGAEGPPRRQGCGPEHLPVRSPPPTSLAVLCSLSTDVEGEAPSSEPVRRWTAPSTYHRGLGARLRP